MKEKRIGPAVIRLLQGDLTTCEVDGVINVTGKKLVPKVPGETPAVPDVTPEPEGTADELDEISIRMGNADGVRAQHVLSAPSLQTTATSGAHKIRKTMRTILETAQEKGFKSLAIPAIGSGINRYPLERCAEILLQELAKSVAQPDNSLEKIVFVLDNQKGYRIFEQALEDFEAQFEQEADA
ncbi:MAG: macro domain-containing protein [Candidatus Sericytochromatia bacterium]|nr:macro domain-containing protein [Candidatus Sericytochromatia bacterium]